MGIIKEQRHNESLEYFGYIEMKNSRIMILSRLESTCKEMASYFRERAYSVIWCTEYDDAVRMMSNEKHRPDLFIFDLSVPAGSEYDVMRSAKLHPDIRTVVLAEDDHLESQLYAYSLQIDDYMVKPVPMELLEAHIGAILRRDVKMNTSVKTVGALTVDYESNRIYLAGEPMTLTAKEFYLLDYFIHHRGVILSRDKILDSVWGYDYVGGYRSVDTLVKKLRAKLTKDHPYIRTVYGVGYCFDI